MAYRYPRNAKMRSKSTNGARIVTQKAQKHETSQEWTRNRYPRTAKPENKSRIDKKPLPENSKIRKQVKNGSETVTQELQNQKTSQE